jgi:GNAT superfamily N-acetyltransferase
MKIEQFDASTDAEQLRSCFEIVAASQRADDPELPVRSLPYFRNRWTTGFGGNRRETWLGVTDTGQPLGCCKLTLPDDENLAMAWCTLAVVPDRRRIGVGRQLLAHCISQARLAGRTRLAGDAREESPGREFAVAIGATGGITEIIRRLDIDSAMPGRLASLRDAARPLAGGYSLVSWIGASPADSIEDQVLLSTAMADAPRDEGVEPEVLNAERIRDLERRCLTSGQQFYSVAARHEATGRLVAITQMYVEPGTPGWGFQMDTAVLPAHRGHRLGLLVKAEMLDLLAAHEPGIRHILTGNGASNQHMIVINEQLGFTITSAYRNWALNLHGRVGRLGSPAHGRRSTC